MYSGMMSTAKRSPTRVGLVNTPCSAMRPRVLNDRARSPVSRRLRVTGSMPIVSASFSCVQPRARRAGLDLGLSDRHGLSIVQELRREGQTVMYVAVDGRPAGLLGVAGSTLVATVSVTGSAVSGTGSAVVVTRQTVTVSEAMA